MSIQRVRAFFDAHGLASRVQVFDVSSATVPLAAQAVGVIPARIAKTLSFQLGDGCMLVVTAGDQKIDNAKFKARLGQKARMLSPEVVLALTGYQVGGVCPFDLPPDIPVYLDVSLQRFDTVFPACGSANSAIGLTCDELTLYAQARSWVDVSKEIASE